VTLFLIVITKLATIHNETKVDWLLFDPEGMVAVSLFGATLIYNYWL